MLNLNLPRVATVSDYERCYSESIWQQVAALICARHRLSYLSLRRSPVGEHIIFFVDRRYVIKIFAPFRQCFLRERAALEAVRGRLPIETPEMLHMGEIEGWSYLVMTQLGGLPASKIWSEMHGRERISVASQLGLILRRLHDETRPLSTAAVNPDWHGFIERQAQGSVERQRACGANPEWLESLPALIEERCRLLPADFKPALLHGDAHPGNLLLSEAGGRWRITGLVDFSDSLCGFHEYDFVTPCVLMVQGDRELQRAMLLSYGYREEELDTDLRARLMLLTVLYECADLRKYALRLNPKAQTLPLHELEAAIWRFTAG